MRRQGLIVMVLLLFVVGLSIVGHAETDLNRLYGLRDKTRLKEIIREAEYAIKKNPSDKDSLKVLGIAYHNLGILEVRGAPKSSVEYLPPMKM